MERQTVIRDLNERIETLARLHIQHGLHHTQGFVRQKEGIARLIRDNEVNLRQGICAVIAEAVRPDRITHMQRPSEQNAPCLHVYKKRRESVTLMKVRLSLNRFFRLHEKDVRWCCPLNCPATRPPAARK